MKALLLALLLSGCSFVADGVKERATDVEEFACGWDKRVVVAHDEPIGMCILVTPGEGTAVAPMGAGPCDADSFTGPIVLPEEADYVVFTHGKPELSAIYVQCLTRPET